MTEEEAKTKWCPHAIASHTNPRQRLSNSEWLHSCIGSACMAWRLESESEYADRCADWAADPQEGANNGPVPMPHGYCGLAGKP